MGSALEEFEGRGRPRFGLELIVFLAAYLLAASLAKRTPFLRSCPLHVGEHTTPAFTDATWIVFEDVEL